MKMKNTLFKRTISAIICLTFLFSQAIDIKPAYSALPTQLPLPDSSAVTIPESLGRITEVFQGSSDKLVFHIQDLHTNPEAQLNSAKIIEHLIDNYDVELMSIEGETGHLDPDWLANVSRVKLINDKMAEILLNSGEMTGEEYLYVTKYPKYKKLTFWGIEGRESYKKNREVFNKTFPTMKDNMRLCDNLKSVLDKLKEEIYPEEAIELDEKRAEYDERELEVKEYTSHLVELANTKGVDLSEFENFAVLAELVAIQDKLEFSKVDKERSFLFSALSRVLSEEEAEDFTETTKSHNEGELTAIGFYTYLKNLAIEKGIDFDEEYPNLITYMEYISTSDKLNNTQLFKELEKVEDKVRDSFLKTDEQKELSRLTKNLNIMRKFFDINLSNENLEYYQANKDEFKVKVFTDFIEEKAKEHNIRYSLNPWLNQLDAALLEQDEFYHVVLVRDRDMVNNTLDKMDEGNFDRTIQICGGFHTKGMMKMLKERDVSYVVISPSVTEEFDEENYRNILINKKKTVEERIEEYGEMLRPDGAHNMPKSEVAEISLMVATKILGMEPKDAVLTLNRRFARALHKKDDLEELVPGITEALDDLKNLPAVIARGDLSELQEAAWADLDKDIGLIGKLIDKIQPGEEPEVSFTTGAGIRAAFYDRDVGDVKVAFALVIALMVYKAAIDKATRAGNKAERRQEYADVKAAVNYIIKAHEGGHAATPGLSEVERLNAEVELFYELDDVERTLLAKSIARGLNNMRNVVHGPQIELIEAIADDKPKEFVLAMVPKVAVALEGIPTTVVEARQKVLVEATEATYTHDSYAVAQSDTPAQMVDADLTVAANVLFTNVGIVRSIHPAGTFMGYPLGNLEGKLIKIVNTQAGVQNSQLKRIVEDMFGIEVTILSPGDIDVATLQGDNLVYLKENKDLFKSVEATRHIVVNLEGATEHTHYLSVYAISYALADDQTQAAIAQVIDPPTLIDDFIIADTGSNVVTITPASNSFFDNALIEALRAIQR